MTPVNPKVPAQEFDVHGILDGKLTIRQPRGGERVAIDAVLLAATIEAKPGERILDVGSGSGAVALCIAHRLPSVHVTGIENDDGLVKLASESAKDNQLAGAVSFHCTDLTETPADGMEGFDQVVTNPPFQPPSRGRVSPYPARARAHTEQNTTLALWVEGCQRRLREGGTITMIFPADRLDQLLYELGKEAGDLRVFPLWPKAGKAAKRVIVRAKRASGAPVRMLAGMLLHRSDGRYTAEAEDILRRGAALPLSG